MLNLATIPIERYLYPPERSYFLFGPRGTGKSTYLEKYKSIAIWIDLLDPDSERQYSAKPERLQDVITASPEKHIVVIDEIQRVPSLLPVVHSIMVKQKNIQFILTGSSARKIKRSGSDLLGGRASERHMHPFMAAELKEEFSLEHALQFGLLPLLYHESNPLDALKAYIRLYLKEEIKMEGLVRNMDNFTRFLETISFSHGAQINASNIARECAVKRKTVENYITILDDLLLSFQLNVFTKRAQRSLSTHPKIYLFDAGVYRVLRPRGPLDSVTEEEGQALEGLVAQHLRAWCDYSDDQYQLYFWRTVSGVEVDFIVYGPNALWAIEVKNTRNVNAQDVKSLRSFREDYPMAKTALIYRGKERIMVNDILCVPAEMFLRQLIPREDIQF